MHKRITAVCDPILWPEDVKIGEVYGYTALNMVIIVPVYGVYIFCGNSSKNCDSTTFTCPDNLF
jgi:hypothetical protein